MKNQIQLLIKNCKKRRINCIYFNSPSELLEWIKEQLLPQSTVGTGDSLSLDELGVFNLLRSEGISFLDKHQTGLSRDEKNNLYLRNFATDFFFSGVNAVSLTGEIVQIDGNGSRVAPIIWGPNKVILVAGTNKIVSTLDKARKRARMIAASLDVKRLNKKTPCAYTGTCQDCKSPDRICNFFVTIGGQFDPSRMTLCIVEGNYGY